MTVRGLICVILEALLLVLGLGTGYRALLMAAFCLGLVLVLAALSLLTVFLTTRAEGGIEPGEVHRGDGVTYTVTVKGPVLLPVAGYLSLLPPGVENRDKQALTRHSFLLLPAFRLRRTVTISQTTPHMGHWKAGAERMRYEDLFGLFRIYLLGIARRRLRRHLTVLPHIHPLTAGDRSAAGANGLTSTLLRSTASGEVLGDARLYQPGDPLKRVHWKLTARTQEIHTRQFEPQENAQVLLLLDLVCRSTRRRETADVAGETALSLLTFFVERNMAVRLMPLRGSRETCHHRHRCGSGAGGAAVPSLYHRASAAGCLAAAGCGFLLCRYRAGDYRQPLRAADAGSGDAGGRRTPCCLCHPVCGGGAG